MKCNFCGANLTLKDETCPYCGHPNEAAKEHIEAMRRYKQDYAEVREEVYETTHRFAAKSALSIFIVVLVILNVCAVIFLNSGWDIYKAVRHSRFESNKADYLKTMDTYLANGDYLEFFEFCDSHDFYNEPEFDAYKLYHHVIYSYYYTAQSLDRYLVLRYETSENAGEPADYDIEYRDSQLSTTARRISEFFEEYNNPNSWYLEYAPADYAEVCKDIENHFRILILSQFDITDEQWNSFGDLSPAGIEKCLKGGAQ